MIGVGDKVVCVNAGVWPEPNTKLPSGLELGAVYTVAAVGQNKYWGDVCVWLVETRNPYPPLSEDVGYRIKRFRKVATSKKFKAIEVFREIDRKIFSGEVVKEKVR